MAARLGWLSSGSRRCRWRKGVVARVTARGLGDGVLGAGLRVVKAEFFGTRRIRWSGLRRVASFSAFSDTADAEDADAMRCDAAAGLRGAAAFGAAAPGVPGAGLRVVKAEFFGTRRIWWSNVRRVASFSAFSGAADADADADAFAEDGDAMRGGGGCRAAAAGLRGAAAFGAAAPGVPGAGLRVVKAEFFETRRIRWSGLRRVASFSAFSDEADADADAAAEDEDADAMRCGCGCGAAGCGGIRGAAALGVAGAGLRVVKAESFGTRRIRWSAVRRVASFSAFSDAANLCGGGLRALWPRGGPVPGGLPRPDRRRAAAAGS